MTKLTTTVFATMALVLGACGNCAGVETFADHPRYGGGRCKGRLGRKLELRWDQPVELCNTADVRVFLLEATNYERRSKIEARLQFDNRNDRTIRFGYENLRITVDGEEYSAKHLLATDWHPDIRGKQMKVLTFAFELPRPAAAGLYRVRVGGVEIDGEDGRGPLGADLEFELPVPGALPGEPGP